MVATILSTSAERPIVPKSSHRLINHSPKPVPVHRRRPNDTVVFVIDNPGLGRAECMDSGSGKEDICGLVDPSWLVGALVSWKRS